MLIRNGNTVFGLPQKRLVGRAGLAAAGKFCRAFTLH
jgi:hypothetical protein